MPYDEEMGGDMPQMGMMKESKKPGNDYMGRVMSGLKYVEEGDLEPIEADIPTFADDGEKVALLVTGIAQGGKISNPVSTEIDLGGAERKGGLRQLMSNEDESEEE